MLAIDAALHAVPHAFGGALALAYHAEPRSTVDIDVNVFVPTDRADDVLEPARRSSASISTARPTAIARTGQTRVMWGPTPIDLFFAYDRFHDAAARASVEVPFADRTIRVLSPEHLAVCKAVFDRPKDWIDIQAMIDQGTAHRSGRGAALGRAHRRRRRSPLRPHRHGAQRHRLIIEPARPSGEDSPMSVEMPGSRS